jgi:histidinol dehydrogenase
MRILSGRSALAMVRQLSTRGVQLTSLEPKVRRIVDDVRGRGDVALRSYAERWDGL